MFTWKKSTLILGEIKPDVILTRTRMTTCWNIKRDAEICVGVHYISLSCL